MQTTGPITIEQNIPNILEQTNLSPAEPTMSLTEDLPFTPRTSQDEGYGHGVSIDSMIVTPHVSMLGEQVPNIGTSADADSEVPENKINLLKQAASTVVATTFSISQDFEDQRLKLTSMTTLAEDRQ